MINPEDLEEYERLTKAVDDAVAMLDQHRQRRIEFQHRMSPVLEGGIIKDGKGEGKVVRCRVGNIGPYRDEWGRPSIEVVRRKKDGTWGSRMSHVWSNWTVVSRSEGDAP